MGCHTEFVFLLTKDVSGGGAGHTSKQRVFLVVEGGKVGDRPASGVGIALAAQMEKISLFTQPGRYSREYEMLSL